MGLTSVKPKTSASKMQGCRRDKRRDSPEYWDARLKRMKLTLDAGRRDWLSYGHVVKDLDFDGRRTYVPITGESLESEEWPLSLH